MPRGEASIHNPWQSLWYNTIDIFHRPTKEHELSHEFFDNGPGRSFAASFLAPLSVGVERMKKKAPPPPPPPPPKPEPVKEAPPPSPAPAPAPAAQEPVAEAPAAESASDAQESAPAPAPASMLTPAPVVVKKRGPLWHTKRHRHWDKDTWRPMALAADGRTWEEISGSAHYVMASPRLAERPSRSDMRIIGGDEKVPPHEKGFTLPYGDLKRFDTPSRRPACRDAKLWAPHLGPDSLRASLIRAFGRTLGRPLGLSVHARLGLLPHPLRSTCAQAAHN